MQVIETPLSGVLVMEPRRYCDDRGFFLENFHARCYRKAGILDDFVQDNHSRSVKGVLRGLHFTVKRPQAQIVTVMRGHIFDVTVDLRYGSPTFGRWFGVDLSEDGPRQLYMPAGFAHGFCVLSDIADLHYKVSQFYDPADDGGLFWNDPDVGIKWPVNAPILSSRDAAHPMLRRLNRDQLPRVREGS